MSQILTEILTVVGVMVASGIVVFLFVLNHVCTNDQRRARNPRACLSGSRDFHQDCDRGWRNGMGLSGVVAFLFVIERPAPLIGSVTDDRPMTAAQAAMLKRLAEEAYELDAFKPNISRAEADIRIAMLTAKLKLLDGPPHTL